MDKELWPEGELRRGVLPGGAVGPSIASILKQQDQACLLGQCCMVTYLGACRVPWRVRTFSS